MKLLTDMLVVLHIAAPVRPRRLCELRARDAGRRYE